MNSARLQQGWGVGSGRVSGLGQWVFLCPQKQTKEAPPPVSQSPEVADLSLDRCVDGLSYWGRAGWSEVTAVPRGRGSGKSEPVVSGHGRLASADAWVSQAVGRAWLSGGPCHMPRVVSSGWLPYLGQPQSAQDGRLPGAAVTQSGALESL